MGLSGTGRSREPGAKEVSAGGNEGLGEGAEHVVGRSGSRGGGVLWVGKAFLAGFWLDSPLSVPGRLRRSWGG